MSSLLFFSSCTSDLELNEIEKDDDQASIASVDASNLSAMPMGSGLDLIDLLGTASVMAVYPKPVNWIIHDCFILIRKKISE